MRRICLAAMVLLVAPTLIAQSPATFEVASVKPNPNQSHGAPRKFSEITLGFVRLLPGGRIESYGYSLRTLIAWAYDVNTLYQKIEGKQDVLETEFDITAKAAAPAPAPAEVKAMVRALLEERFQLRWRLQPREIDGYALMPSRDDGRPGPGLRPFTGDCDARAANPPVRFESPDYEEKARCGWSGINDRQRAVGVSTKTIADRLLPSMGAPVSDRTGWPGLFTFDVKGTTRDMPGQQILMRQVSATLGAPLPTDAPQLLDVFRSELGLKLVKERLAINDFIVERAEPLIEN